MSGLFETWRERGHEVLVGGRRIFCLDSKTDVDAEAESNRGTLVVLHGFPTSSLDFHRVWGAFSEGWRVVVHDHPGFGFSAKPADTSYSLLEQAETAFELWRELGVNSAHLLAHDYGTSVATEVLARRERGGIPVELRSVTLSNGSLLLDLARLRLSQRILRSKVLGPIFQRLVTRAYFKRVMRRLWADPRRADEADLDAMWRGVRFADGHLRTAQVSCYLDERVRFRERWIGALKRCGLPVHLLWGRRDPVAVPAIAERLAEEVPGARVTWLDDVGHYPMLEDPEGFSAAATAFWRAAAG